MRMPLRAAVWAACSLLAACASAPLTDATTTRVSLDYVAAGRIQGVRAYLYGERTLLEFGSAPIFLSVVDANGVPVLYERQGRFVRMDRKLDEFTVRANLKVMVFHLLAEPPPIAVTEPAPTMQAEPAPTVEAAPSSPSSASLPALLEVAQTPQADADVIALVNTAAQQLEEVRKAIAQGARDTNELHALNAKLDAVEVQLSKASSAVLMVYFRSYNTYFRPKPELTRVLVPAARAADQVNLRGRTDSAVAGPGDGNIAKARARSAQRFLVRHGVAPSKITVSSRANGDWIAPRTTAGRATNRRVEIEIVNSHIAALARQSRELARGHVGTN